MVTREQLERIKRVWDKYRVRQDVVVGADLTLEDWNESGRLWGRVFWKSDEVKGFVAYGDQYPLSGIDSSVEEILALTEGKTMEKKIKSVYIVLCGSTYEGFGIHDNAFYQTKEQAEKVASRIAKDGNKGIQNESKKFIEMNSGLWLSGHDYIMVDKLNSPE